MRESIVKRSIMLLLCMTTAHQYAASGASSKIKQLAIIPNFLSPEGLKTTTQTMADLQKGGRTYIDYGRRRGGIWSNFWVDPNNPNPADEYEKIIRLTQVSEQIGVIEKPESRVAESLFDYPELKEVVAKEILPRMFSLIKTKKWATLSEKDVFIQFYLQGCSESEEMDWHQDPGEPEWKPMANFSLVLMLSDQQDPVHGWKGGEFKIRLGKPYDADPAEPKTIIHKLNQALLFNNRINCHRAETVTGTATSTRDLVVVCLYLKKAPEAVPEFDQRAFYATIKTESQL